MTKRPFHGFVQLITPGRHGYRKCLRFETFCYGPLSCKYYSMGPARAVPYKGVSGVKDEGWLDEICVEYRLDPDE